MRLSLLAAPQPYRINVEQFHKMGAAGVFEPDAWTTTSLSSSSSTSKSAVASGSQSERLFPLVRF